MPAPQTLALCQLRHCPLNPPLGSVLPYLREVVEGRATNPLHKRQTLYFIIMTATVEFSREVMLGMLRKGSTGADILNILDVIVPETQDETAPVNQGTLEPIAF